MGFFYLQGKEDLELDLIIDDYSEIGWIEVRHGVKRTITLSTNIIVEYREGFFIDKYGVSSESLTIFAFDIHGNGGGLLLRIHRQLDSPDLSNPLDNDLLNYLSFVIYSIIIIILMKRFGKKSIDP